MKSSLQAELDALLLWMGDKSAQTFQTGLSDSEIDALTHNTPYRISEELRTLYKWRNGQRFDDERGIRLPFSIYAFLPLDYAVDRALHLAEMSEDWKETWLPILSNGAGDDYFCDCSIHSPESAVYYYFLYSESENRVEPKFTSVRELLNGIIQETDEN